MDQELPKEEAERRAREVAQRMLSTPKKLEQMRQGVRPLPRGDSKDNHKPKSRSNPRT